MKTAKLSVLPIKDLNPAEYNPRKKLKPGDKEYEKIKHSIEEFGFADPVVVNSDMTIIGGHQRVTVAAALGYTEVPCAIVEVSKTQEKALNIALNKISGEWNQELLADLIQDLQDSDFDVGFTGFEPPEIEQLFSKVHDKKVKEDDFDVEAELKKPTVAQTGDVWLLGKHRVICGDSILPETYNILMDGRKANLVLTDPPYNVDVEETAGKIKNDNMADEDFYRFLFAAFVNMEQNMEDDASIYVFHADTEGLNFRKAFADAGFKLSGCCIWKKNALVLGRSPYQWQHEPCLFGWKKGGKHRVLSLDETCRELNRKYILPIGYERNNMFLTDWSEEEFAELDFYDMFDLFYQENHTANGEFTFGNAMGTSAVYLISKEKFEPVIKSKFKISSEVLQSKTVYYPCEEVYEYKPRGLEETEYPEYPYPEVIGYVNNDDGTLTLKVQAVFPYRGVSKAYIHEVTVRDTKDGGIQYVGNRIIEPINNPEIRWHVPRLTRTEWEELYGDN